MGTLLVSRIGTRIRAIIGLCLLVFCVAASPRIDSLVVDNSIARWIDETPDHPDSFDDLAVVFVAVSGSDPLSRESLDALVQVTGALESIPDVARVEGVGTVYRDQFGLEDREALLEELSTTPYFQRLLVTPDRAATGLFIFLSPDKAKHSDRVLVAQIDEALAPIQDQGLTATIAGPVVLNAELDQISMDESALLFPMAVLLSSFVLFITLRSLRAAIAAILASGVTLILLVEGLAISGTSLNMITISVPPLVWVLSLSGSIHIIQRVLMHQQTHPNRRAAIQSGLSDLAWPNVLAASTTALGFLTLRVSNMAPVRELGLIVALGMVITMAVHLCVLPLFLWMLRPEQSKAQSLPHTRPERSDKPILITAILVAIAAVPGVFLVRADSDPLHMFKSDSDIRRQYAALPDDLAGPFTLETVIQLPETWLEPETWPVVEAVSETLRNNLIATKTISPLDTLRVLNLWVDEEGTYCLPESRLEAESLLEELDESSHPLSGELTDFSGTHIRMVTFINEMDSGAFLAYVDSVNEILDALPDGYSGFTTGSVLKIVQAQRALVKQQFTSFAYAFGTIFICLFAGLRSWKLLLISIPPNLLPILVTVGLMGYLRIPLDTGSVMVASVVLGIGVDDTVHTLVAVSRNSTRPDQAIRSIAPALKTTTLVIGSGFLVLVTSAFMPLVHFGALATTAIAIALWADLKLVPAMLRRDKETEHA